MRKITQEAVNAFMNGYNYKKSNTEVRTTNTGEYIVSELFLHSNRIARKEEDCIEITTAGWNTNTTKERLRGIPGVHYLISKKGKLYLNDNEWDGEWTCLEPIYDKLNIPF